MLGEQAMGLWRRWKAPATLSLIFVLAVLLTWWRFWPWVAHVFYGDDLTNFLSFRDGDSSSFIRLLVGSETFGGKYRPVLNLVLLAASKLFGTHIGRYLAVNILLQALNAVLLFAIARRLSGGRWLVSLAVALAAATSRFALYQVTQVTGLVEGLALVFLLATVYCVIRAGEDERTARGWTWLGLACGFLALNTHERYVGVFPWIFLAILLLPALRARPWAERKWLLFACFAAPLSNALYKMVVLQTQYFVGTGGTHLDIDTARIHKQLHQALTSVFGFNSGPEYLAGFRTTSLPGYPTSLLLLGIAMSVILALVFISALRELVERSKNSPRAILPKLAWPFLLISLSALLLVPPALTIRMEQRWLFEPFILLLLFFAWATNAAHYRFPLPAWIVAVLLASVSLSIDSLVAAGFPHIFFVKSERFALAVKRDIVDPNSDKSSSLGFIEGQDFCDWVLHGGRFFELYGGQQRHVYCFDTQGQVSESSLQQGMHIYADTGPRLVDVTADSEDEMGSRGATVAVDFLKAFPSGRINSTQAVTTPSGQGVFLKPWYSTIGLQDSLTVISGFSYRYDDIPIPSDAWLRFGVSMIYPSSAPATVAVYLTPAGDALPQLLYTQDLTPPQGSVPLAFKPVRISLAAYAHQHVSLTFAVTTWPGLSPDGHWVGFTEPRIVIDAHR